MQQLKRICVGADGHRLTLDDGTPFFWLGDTAWELFHRLNREEAAHYLETRARQGFNVIQAVGLAELDGLSVPNAYGHLPLQDGDPERLVEAYWQHVDWIVDRANSLGLYVAFLPTWGDKWNRTWGTGPEIFTPANARVFGELLGKRYRNAALVWVTGGDRAVRDEHDLAIIGAMAEGLREGDGGAHCITYHPSGGCGSSQYVHHAPWLDFNMVQTGHSRERHSYLMLERERSMIPSKPFVNAEPAYEAHANSFKEGATGWLDQQDVRRDLYWTICEGGAGHTYGCHAVWQMYAPPREPINFPRATWRESLDYPGAQQMRHALTLCSRYPIDKCVPDSSMIRYPESSGLAAIRACRTDDRTFVVVYTPEGQRFTLHGNALRKQRVAVTFFNPRAGESTDGGVVDGSTEMTIMPPFDPFGRDWVTILDGRG